MPWVNPLIYPQINVTWTTPMSESGVSMTWVGTHNLSTWTVIGGSVSAYGTNTNDGTVVFGTVDHSGYNNIVIKANGPAPGNFINNGTFASNNGEDFITISGDATSKFTNNGTVQVCGPTTISTALAGKGTMQFMPPREEYGNFPANALVQGVLELDKSVSCSQVIDMTATGVLKLGDLRDFHAIIKGFTLQSSIDFIGLNIKSFSYAEDFRHHETIIGTSAGSLTFDGLLSRNTFHVAATASGSVLT